MTGAAGRWWIYQRERFPLAAHGLLVAAFSLGAIAYSAALRGAGTLPGRRAAAVAFVSAFLFFLQLRIADEFKDAAEDRRWRPYRPVPRGLIALRELGWLGAAAAALQVAAAAWLDWRMVALLLVTWTYLGLMSREFFARAWLLARPFTYAWTHMLIMPLVDFYVTACDWIPAAGAPPAGLGWFIAASLSNGFVLEIGRKIRAPADEERGVRTYSKLWGRRGALAAWGAALLLTTGCALAAGGLIGRARSVAAVLGSLLTLAALAGASFLARPRPGRGRWFEGLSGLWTLALYVTVGLVPWIRRWLAS